MNVSIYVEGQEEELFVSRVLRGHLAPLGVTMRRPILAATSFRIGSDNEPEVTVGGVTSYRAIRQDILDHFASKQIKPEDVLTTLIDLYGLPAGFPGHSEAVSRGLHGAAKADHIENAWRIDIGLPNFFPYIQVHEFEALILTRPSVLSDFYPEFSGEIERLRSDCAPFSSPEEINETKATSPSHRILSTIPSYTKIDGFRHLQAIGIPELKAHCPRFRAWVERCERKFV